MTTPSEQPLVSDCKVCGQQHTQLVRDGKPVTFEGFAFFTCDALPRGEWSFQ